MECKVFGGKWSWPNLNTVLYQRVWNNRAVTQELQSGKRCVTSGSHPQYSGLLHSVEG